MKCNQFSLGSVCWICRTSFAVIYFSENNGQTHTVCCIVGAPIQNNNPKYNPMLKTLNFYVSGSFLV